MADALAESLGLAFKKSFFKPYLAAVGGWVGDHRIAIVKPQTYMNRSGEVFSANPDFLPGPETRVLVFCDQMDLPPGGLRLKSRGGSGGGHNGLKSISQEIGDGFCPLYIGIGRPEAGVDVVAHVLGEPAPADRDAIDAAVARAVDRLRIVAADGLDAAMSALNQRPADAESSPSP